MTKTTVAIIAQGAMGGGTAQRLTSNGVDVVTWLEGRSADSRARAEKVLDYGGTSAAIGKNTGDDFRERKLTLPVIKAVAQATAEERAFWVRVIEKGQQGDGDLEQALAIMARHGAMEAARDDALAWSARARAALAPLPDHPLRGMLDALADYVVARLR